MKKLLNLLIMAVVTCCLFISACATDFGEIGPNTPSGDSSEVVRPGSSAGDSSSILDDSSSSSVDDSSSSGEDVGGGNEEIDEPLRVIFFGNSLMFFNDMPSLFRNLAEKSGKQVYVDSVTRGSATISDFANSTTDVGSQAYNKLQTQSWDYVIIEPSRRITPYEDTVYKAELAAAKVMQRMAENAGAKILLYCVWGNNDGTLTEYNATNPIAMVKGQVHYDYTRKDHVKFLRKVNENISEALGGVGIIDAGYAFENCIAEYPAINLYDTDERHPSLEGSYLAAATVYATIYGESPENIGFTGGSVLYFEMQRMAKATVIDKRIPDLTNVTEEIEQVDDPNVYDILFIGSDLIDSYDATTPLTSMISLSEGLGLNIKYMTNSTGVFNRYTVEGGDYLLKDTLARTKYDAIVMQITRRCTPSATDVEASELAALKKIYPILAENTDNVYLYTFNGQTNPSIFTTVGGADSYTKTDSSEKLTSAQMNEYYTALAKSWAQEVGCKYILQGSAWTEASPSSDADKGYVRALALYYGIFDKQVPEGVNTNGIEQSVQIALQQVVEKHCMPSYEAPVIPELPDPETYDVLVIGSKLIGNLNIETSLSSMVQKGQGKQLYLEYVTNSVGVFNKIAQKDSSDTFYSDYLAAMQSRRWDAIVLQISRRCTPGSAVEIAQLNAIKSILPELKQNTQNLFLVTLDASENPNVFLNEGIEYTKSSYKIGATLAEMTEYFNGLALSWAQEIEAKAILYGSAWAESNPENNAQKAYLRACCLYNTILNARVPADADTNGVSEDIAQDLRLAALNNWLYLPESDLTELNTAIAMAEGNNASDYTPNSYSALLTALSNAKLLTVKNEQEEIDQAVIALNNAIAGLVLRADFTALNSAIANARGKAQSNYTTDSWNALATALAEAEALDENATQEQVNARESALTEAIEKLVVKADLTALKQAIALAESKDEGDYTVVSWNILKEALENAKLLDENSDAIEVGNATVALNNAISGLNLKANLSELNALIAEIQLLDERNYTLDSWTELENSMMGAGDMTVENSQEEVDAVIEVILYEKQTLVVIPTYETYDILFIGSDLIEDEYIAPSLSSMISLGQGQELYLHYVTDGVGVINRLVYREENASDDDLYTRARTALNERRWDSIIIQFSRRATPESAVADSEFTALSAIYPTLTRNCEDIYIFTLNGSGDASIFSPEGVSYEKTGETSTVSAADMGTYYQTVVEEWCAELGCKSILYGSAYNQMSPSTSKAKGFMRALCIYYSIFGEEMPSGTNVQGTSSSGVTKIKAAAAKYCLVA